MVSPPGVESVRTASGRPSRLRLRLLLHGASAAVEMAHPDLHRARRPAGLVEVELAVEGDRRGGPGTAGEAGVVVDVATGGPTEERGRRTERVGERLAHLRRA